MEDLTTHERTLDGALQRLQTGEAALLRPDGTRLWSDDEHERKASELRDTFTASVATVEELATAEYASARQAEEMLEVVDPADTLTEAELGRANQRLAITESDWRDLPVDQLIANARAALASGDRARAYLQWRGCYRRLQAEQAAGRRVSAVELGTVYHDLTAAVADPKAGEKKAAARRRRKTVEGLRSKIFNANLESRGGIAGLKRELAASGRYSL